MSRSEAWSGPQPDLKAGWALCAMGVAEKRAVVAGKPAIGGNLGGNRDTGETPIYLRLGEVGGAEAERNRRPACVAERRLEICEQLC